MNTRISLSLILMLALGGTACGSAIEGDWFVCDDISCNELDNEGARFNSDGTVQALGADGSKLDPGERYCHSPVLGQWALDADVLSISIFDGSDFETSTARVTIEGDFLTLVIDGDTMLWQAVDTPDSFACPGSTSFGGSGVKPVPSSGSSDPTDSPSVNPSGGT